MKKQMRAALAVIFMLVCTIAQATNLDIKIQSTYASEWSGYLNNTYDIKFTDRIFTANAWDGICLPFDMNETQLINTFGENGYEIRSFKEMNGNKFVFENASTITHGVPYLIKIKNGIAEDGTVRFKGVTIASSVTDDYIKVEPTPGLQFRGFYFRKYGSALVDDQGGHAQYTIKPDGTLEKNHWYNDPGCIGPYAYFYVNDASTVTTIGVEGVTTGSGSGEGGGETPDLTTLDGKIAARVQLTDAPTIYIDIPDVTNIDADLKKDRGNNTAEYHYATIKVVATSDENSPHYLKSFEETNSLDMQIKVRGNSTADPLKRPYRLKFAKKHKHDLLGRGYDKRNWVLLANYFDRSMLRNALTYHLGKAVGMDFCPGYKFVDLVINGDYRGTYQVSDHCEADADRIKVDEDTGWILEAARGDMCEEPMVTAGGATWSIKNPEYETDEEISQLKSEVSEWLNNWNNSINQYIDYPYLASSIKGWRAFSDEDSFAKFYIAINITGDYDGFMTVKAYREADGKLFLGPLWDKDLAYGNYTGDNGETLVQDFPNGMLGGKFSALLKDPIFVSKLKSTMDKLVEDGLIYNLCNKVDEMAEQIKNTRELNYTRWDITSADYIWASYHSYSDYQKYVDDLKAYLRQHIPFIKQHIDDTYATVVGTPTDATYTPNNSWDNQNLTMKKVLNETVVNRTLTGGQWNTFCVPFSATQAQMVAALGCNYELKVHTGMDSDGKTMLFSTPETLDISAAYPYLIKPASDVNSMVFQSVVNTDCADKTANYNGEGVTFDNKHYFYASLFHGYELNTATDYLFSNDVYTDNTSLINTTTNNQNGCRAFIRVPEGETAAIKMGEVVIEDLEFDVNDGAASAKKVGGTYNITLKNRGKLYADGWCTICLPFTITKKNFEAKIGPDTKLRGLASIQGTSFNFDKVDDKTLHAGVPYLIMIDTPNTTETTVNLDDFTFENTKLETAEGTSVSPKDGYAFVGILSSKQLAADGTQLFMGANNELYKPSSTSGKLGGGKAYFQIPGKASAGNAKVNVIIDGIETTMVEQVVTDFNTSHQDIYNLNGQKMNGSSLKSLPHGIYIINGKKITK